jgi:hypothetical protein
MQQEALFIALNRGWEIAAYRPIDDVWMAEMLRLIREHWPLQSAIVYELDAATKSLLIAGATGANASAIGRQAISCTDSKWQELDKWMRSGGVLRQNSPRRSGKLAILTPEEFSESLAIPLFVDGAVDGAREELALYGAVVFEIESCVNRSRSSSRSLVWSDWASAHESNSK